MSVNLKWIYVVRTPFDDEETFNASKDRITNTAKENSWSIQWWKGSGYKGAGRRHHYWFCQSHDDATALYLAMGDEVNNRLYPDHLLGEQNMSTKTEYLALISQWKNDYQKLSVYIRQLKLNVKAANRQYGDPSLSSPVISTAYLKYKEARLEFKNAVIKANEMLEHRAKMKVEAVRRYKESK